MSEGEGDRVTVRNGTVHNRALHDCDVQRRASSESSKMARCLGPSSPLGAKSSQLGGGPRYDGRQDCAVLPCTFTSQPRQLSHERSC